MTDIRATPDCTMGPAERRLLRALYREHARLRQTGPMPEGVVMPVEVDALGHWRLTDARYDGKSSCAPYIRLSGHGYIVVRVLSGRVSVWLTVTGQRLCSLEWPDV